MLFSILNMKFPGEAGQNLQSEMINKKIPHKKGGAGGMWVPPASYEKSLFIKQVFLVYVYSIRKSYEVSL